MTDDTACLAAYLFELGVALGQALDLAREQAGAVITLSTMVAPPTNPACRQRLDVLVSRARALLAEQPRDMTH